MAIELVTVICTKCDQPMKLPQHIADLPAHARLCAVCVRALLPLFVPQAEQAGMFEAGDSEAVTPSAWDRESAGSNPARPTCTGQ